LANPIKEFFYSFVKDIKEDFKAITEIKRRAGNNEKIFQGIDWKKEKKEFSIAGFFKEVWLWYLIIILAFLSGWWVASQKYEAQANQFILDNCIESLTIDSINPILIPININGEKYSQDEKDYNENNLDPIGNRPP